MKTSKIFVNNDRRVVVASVPVYFFKISGDKYIHAQCSPLGIITSGSNLEKAKAMFKEAFRIWLDYVEEKGNIRDVLKELGWKLTRTTAIPKEKPIGVPIELLASRVVNLEVPTTRLN
ncbi:MAG: hypothetical protein LE178_04820 [Endomicrobium sp.]|jgi:predicted RNase H-like HicB family nuclease|nr:hypothetical protein [Endomicrobium sp.]